MRGYRVALTEPLRSMLDKNGGLDLGELGKFIPDPTGARARNAVGAIYGVDAPRPAPRG